MVRVTRFWLIVLVGLGIGLLTPNYVQAADVLNEACADPQVNAESTVCQENAKQQTDVTNNPIYGTGGVLISAGRLIATITGIASVFVVVISGASIMLAAGDSARINRARVAIIYALVGLVVSILASALIRFVIGKAPVV